MAEPITDEQILDLIKKYESRGQNITNYAYSETSSPPRTAQGYYQITNQNWNSLGPKLGIDLAKYPRAMAAPESEQRKVARELLKNTSGGITNWNTARDNPEFRGQLVSGGFLSEDDPFLTGIKDTTPQPKQQKISEASMPQTEDTGMPKTREEALKYIQAHPQDYPELYKKYFPQQGQVKPPEKGWLERWTEAPQSIASLFLSPGQEDVKKLTRGVAGYDTGATRVRDVTEGAMGLASQVASAYAPFEIGTKGLLGGLTSLAKSSIKPAAITGTTTGLGYEYGQQNYPDDPEAQRASTDVGAAAGMGLSLVPNRIWSAVGRNPYARAAVAHIIGQKAGFPLLGDIIAGGEATGLRKAATDFVKGKMGVGGGIKVEPPPPGMKPPTPEKIQEMFKRGSITQDRMDELLKGGKLTAQELAKDALNQHHEEAWGEYKSDQEKKAAEAKATAEKHAQMDREDYKAREQRWYQEKQKEADLQRRAAEKQADIEREEAKEREERAFQLVQKGEGGPSLSTSALSGITTNQPIHVKLPDSNITVHGAEPTQQMGQVNLPQGGFPQMPQTNVAQSPTTPAPAPTGIVQFQGRPTLPAPNLPPVAEMTPAATNLKTPSEEFESFADTIAKAAYRLKQRPVVTSNDLSLKGMIKKFGLDRMPTRQHLERAQEIFDDLKQKDQRTPNYPGKGNPKKKP